MSLDFQDIVGGVLTGNQMVKQLIGKGVYDRVKDRFSGRSTAQDAEAD
jgi:hypothetical protein